MSHKDMNFADQVRLIQLVVGVPVDGKPSNTNAIAMTKLTGLSGKEMWKMSTEQFMDEVASRMKSEPDFKAQVLENISNVTNPQHQALLNSFASGAGVSLAPQQEQTQQQTAPPVETQPLPPTEQQQTNTPPLNVETANTDALRLQGLLAANNGDYSEDNITGNMNQPTLDRINSNTSLAANIAAQEKQARETATVASLASFTDMDLTQPNIMAAIQSFLSAIFGINFDLTGEMNPQVEEGIKEAHTLLETRDGLIAEIAEHASNDLSVAMASVNDSAGLAITVKGHTMSFDKDALTARGGSFKELIAESPEALIALEASKGAEATGILLNAAGLPLEFIRPAIESAPDSPEKTAFLARIDNGGAAVSPSPTTYSFHSSADILQILESNAEGIPVGGKVIATDNLNDPALYSDAVTAFLDEAANDPAALAQAIDAIKDVLGNDAAKIEAVKDAYTGGNADVVGTLNDAILSAAPTNTQTPDPSTFFIPAMNALNGVFEIVGAHPETGQDIVMAGIDPQVFLDPATYESQINGYLDVAAQNDAVLTTTLNMLISGTGNNPDHLNAIQAVYNGGNPEVISQFNAAIQAAKTAAANVQNNQGGASPISYRLSPDMPNNAYVILASDAAGGEQVIDFLPMEAFDTLDPNAVGIDPMNAGINAARIGEFLDVAANDPAVLAQSINVIQNAVGSNATKLEAVRDAYTGGNQAVVGALAAIVPVVAAPANEEPATESAAENRKSRRDRTKNDDAVNTAGAGLNIPDEVESAVVGAVLGAAGGGTLGHLADQATGRRSYRAANREHIAAVEAYNKELDAMHDAAVAQNDYDEETRQNAEAKGRESAERTAHTIIPQQDTAPKNWRERAVNATSRLVLPTRAAQDDISNIARERMGQAHADVNPERTVRLDGDANANFDLDDNGRQTLGFAYQDAADQITERAQPGRARNWVNNNVPLIGDTLRRRSEQRTANLVAHGEAEIQDIDQKLDESFEQDAQDTIDERNASRPDVPENPTAPGDAPNKQDFSRNKYAIVLGAAGAVALGAMFAASPSTASELEALAPEVMEAAYAGDYVTAGQILQEVGDEKLGSLFRAFDNAGPDAVDVISQAVVAKAMGDGDTASSLLSDTGLISAEAAALILVGDYVGATKQHGIDMAHGVRDLGLEVAGAVSDAYETGGALNAAGVIGDGAFQVLVADTVEFGGSVIATGFRAIGSGGGEATPEQKEFWSVLKDVEALSGDALPNDAPQGLKDLASMHVAIMSATDELDVLMQQPHGFGNTGLMQQQQDAEQKLLAMQERYENHYDSLAKTGGLDAVVAYFAGDENPAPDAVPAPSPDSAVGAFAEVSADAVEIPEVIALAHDSESLGLGIVSVSDPNAVEQYAAAWDRDPIAMADVVKTAIKEMMGGMESADYKTYLAAVNNYYGSTIADVMRPDGEAEAVLSAVTEVGAELGFAKDDALIAGTPEGGATSYKAAPMS